MNILVIAPHMDDEVLGCGAAIAKHVDDGDSVYVCCLCSDADFRSNKPENKKFNSEIEKSRNILGIKDNMDFTFPNISFNTVPRLDIVQAIEKAILKWKPEVRFK